MRSANKSANNKKLSVISAVIIASLIIAGAISSAASASNISNMSRGGGTNSPVSSPVSSPVNSPVNSTNTGTSETPNSSLVDKPPKRELNDHNVLSMSVCTANITKDKGTKYLVIKPEGNSTDCVISGNHHPKKLFWDNVYKVISSPESDGATLRFEGNVYGYGELIKYPDPDLSGVATGSWGLFENSGIKSLGNIWRFDVSNVTSFEQLFKNCKNLTDVSGLKYWDVSNVKTMEEAFNGCNELSDISALSTWDVSKVTSFRVMFGETDLTSDSLKALKDWDVRNVKDMSSLFYNCTYLTNVDALSKWKVGSVTSMAGMFDSCSNLKNADGMKDWNMSKVTSMHEMFYRCRRLEHLDASKWDVSNVTQFNQMFDGCGSNNIYNAVINFSNKTFNKNADMTSAFIDYYGVFIANNWNTNNITNINLKDKYAFGTSDQIGTSDQKSSGSIVITDNDKILTEFKGYAFTPVSKKVTIRYKNKKNSFNDNFKNISVPLPTYAFYDSRIDTSTGKVDKSKPASYDAFAIVNPYVYKLINYYVKLLRTRNAQYELPEYYDIVPSKNFDKTNVMSLFQEYYLAPKKMNQVIKGKIKYEADSTLTYNKQNKISDPVDGSGYVKFGAFDAYGNWDEDATTVLSETKKPKDGVTKIGNVETKEEVINFNTKRVDDSSLNKGQTEIITAGKNGSRKVTTMYVVDPDKGLTSNIESVRGEYIAPVDEVIHVGTKEDPKPPTPPTPPAPEPPAPPTPPEPSNPEEPGGNDPDTPHNPHNPNNPNNPDNPNNTNNPDNPPYHGDDTTPEEPSDTGRGINPVWPYIPELNIHGDVNKRPDASSNNNGDNHRPGSAGGLNSSPRANSSDAGNANNANSNNRNGMNFANNAKIHGALSKTGSAAFPVMLVAFAAVIIGLIGIYAVKRNSSKHKNSRHSITYNFIR